ncbi:MAG: TPM domain-containing protein [Acidobacteriota bacterium]
MPRRSFRLLPLLIFLGPLCSVLAGLDVPRLRGRVNDLAGLLSAEESSALDARLADLERTDSTQVAVLIIPGLEGEALEDYSERVATAWQLGVRGNDNGALLLIALRERRVRIEVGYGLEATLTDALSRRIIETEITPEFREGDYLGGIDRGVTAVIQAVRGVYRASERSRPATSSGRSARGIADMIIFLLVPLFWTLRALGRWGGAILGAGAGAYLAFSVSGGSLAALSGGALAGAVLGLVLGSLMRAAGGGRRGGFMGPIHFGGRSGLGGGGFSGGGFSGGGGRFGGGGASGSW